MNFPLALQPNCCSIVGQLRYKFADLLFLDERRERSMIERIAAYAFNFFITFPTLTVCALGEVLGQLWTMPWVYLQRAYNQETRNFKVKESVHTIGTNLLFPLVALGYAFLGRLAPANRVYPLDHPLLLKYAIANNIYRGNKHLTEYLLSHYLSAHQDPNTDRTNPLGMLSCLDYFSMERYQACQALIPLLEKSSQEVKEYAFINALCHQDLSLLLILWPLIRPEMQQEALSLYHFCEEIIQRQSPPRSLLQRKDQAETHAINRILSNSREQLLNHPFCKLLFERREPWKPERTGPPTELDLFHTGVLVEHTLIYLQTTCLIIYKIIEATSKGRNCIQKELENHPTIPFPGVIAKMVVDYLPNDFLRPKHHHTHVSKIFRDYDLFRIWDKDRYYLSVFHPFRLSIINKYTKVIGDKLFAISYAIEKTLFSLHLKGYSSAKFLGSLTLGAYQTMEIWALRPLIFCGVLLAVVANKVHQLFFSLAKAIRSPIDRRTNLKKSALAIPELVGSVCIIALQPLIAVWRALTMDMAQPIHRSLNLYMRCTYASKH